VSKAFPTEKDELLDELERVAGADLDDADYAELRKLTRVQLSVLIKVISRSQKRAETES
jgi:hypothetical protein